jgi:hypothetical protein
MVISLVSAQLGWLHQAQECTICQLSLQWGSVSSAVRCGHLKALACTTHKLLHIYSCANARLGLSTIPPAAFSALLGMTGKRSELLCTAVRGLRAGSLTTTVSMLCCVSGNSYAKARADAATCFQHIAPGTTAAQCTGAPSASGYYSRGAKSARLFIAQSSSSCSDTLQVGTAKVSCPEGNMAKKVGFTVVTSAPHRYVHAQLHTVCCALGSRTLCLALTCDRLT